MIRAFEDADRAAVRALFVQLQDHEKAIYPESASGEEIVDAYLDWMFTRCRNESGLVGIAEHAERVVGFVTVLRAVERTDPDDPVPVHAYVSELSVEGAMRGRGVGSALLEWAQARAREAGRDELRIAAVAVNEGARRLYERVGFTPVQVIYAKRLAS